MTTIIDELVFDRTQEDVDRVKDFKRRILNNGWNSLSQAEKTEYLAGMKGAYNATDLNRIGQAIDFIAGNMVAAAATLAAYRAARGVAEDSQFDLPVNTSAVSEIDAKTDWTIPDIPAKAQTDQILADIATLRAGMPLPVDAPDLPANMDALDYLIANDIEYLLYAIDEAFNGLTEDIEGRIDRAADAWYYSSETNCGG